MFLETAPSPHPACTEETLMLQLSIEGLCLCHRIPDVQYVATALCPANMTQIYCLQTGNLYSTLHAMVRQLSCQTECRQSSFFLPNLCNRPEWPAPGAWSKPHHKGVEPSPLNPSLTKKKSFPPDFCSSLSISVSKLQPQQTLVMVWL